MVIDSPRDMRFVMFPAYGFAALLVALSPLMWLLYERVGPSATGGFLLGSAVYYGTYEVVHVLVHLPRVQRRNVLVRAAARHHEAHHRTDLMRHYNFNFAIPLFDVL